MKPNSKDASVLFRNGGRIRWAKPSGTVTSMRGPRVQGPGMQRRTRLYAFAMSCRDKLTCTAATLVAGGTADIGFTGPVELEDMRGCTIRRANNSIGT